MSWYNIVALLSEKQIKHFDPGVFLCSMIGCNDFTLKFNISGGQISVLKQFGQRTSGRELSRQRSCSSHVRINAFLNQNFLCPLRSKMGRHCFWLVCLIMRS